MAAVRVPPSAWMTSQSSLIDISPMASKSVTARRLRPIRRWISWLRPDWPPWRASRPVRVLVARGSMPYSAVTQPWPEFLSHGGTRSSMVAVMNTLVSPKPAMHDPSACLAKSGSSATARISSARRPEGL